MALKEIEVDETPHNMDGLLLHGWDGSERVEAFISRRSWRVGSIRGSPIENGEVCFARNTTPSASSILRRLSELPLPSTSAGLRFWRYCAQCTVLRLWSKDRPPTDGQHIQPPYNRKGLAWSDLAVE